MDCDYEEENVTKSKRQLKREAKKGKKKPAFHNLDAHATDAGWTLVWVAFFVKVAYFFSSNIGSVLSVSLQSAS